MRGSRQWVRLLASAVSVAFGLAFHHHTPYSLELPPPMSWLPRRQPSVSGIHIGRTRPVLQNGSRWLVLAAAPGGLRDRFARWRWLQRLLDEETDADDSNRVLYQVLNDFLINPSEEIEGAPVLTPARREMLEILLGSVSDGRVEALTDDASDPSSSVGVLEQLEQLLPDPSDEEDAHKSLWDIVLELHGREAVKINEQSGRAEWKARCLVARILIFYDFLTSEES